MNLLLIPGVITLVSIIRGVSGVDYCDIKSCGIPSDHTMCKYKDGKVACAAEKKGVKAGLTEELKKLILEQHNSHKQRVAQGKQPRQPGASDMMKLSWHDEAATIAQRWADQCKFAHDACRDLQDTRVGQNIAMLGVDIKRYNGPDVIKRMIQNWYDEVQFVDQKLIDSFQASREEKAVGHYSQLVWAKTTGVGCGLIEMQNDEETLKSSYLFCNYVPGGNLIGQPIYKEGKACSSCPGEAKCSKSYPGLCTEDKTDFEDQHEVVTKQDDTTIYHSEKGDATSQKPSMLVLSTVFAMVFFFKILNSYKT